MKRFMTILFTVSIVTFLFAGSASATLVPGTWYSNQGTDRILLGFWSETESGSYPTFIGTTGTEWSDPLLGSGGGSWSSATTRGATTTAGSIYTFGLGWAQDITINFSQYAYSCIFWGDGLPYSASLTATGTYTQYYSNSSGARNTIVGIGPLSISGNGPITGQSGWYASYLATATYDPAKKTPTGWGGNMTYGQLTLTQTPIPIPGAIWIFGSALLGLLGIRRRLG